MYLFSYLSHVTSFQNFQIRSQCTALNYFVIFFFSVISTKKNISPHSVILYPGLLRNISYRTLKRTKTSVEMWPTERSQKKSFCPTCRLPFLPYLCWKIKILHKLRLIIINIHERNKRILLPGHVYFQSELPCLPPWLILEMISHFQRYQPPPRVYHQAHTG